mmetsp:Transcript_14544/g.26337  ORF Transcript_14544/g.26337 Transcript_14544/m.26337 type:complete len:187 (-) Transcript_14544:102-662(-)|eukprot:CAMPEP_0202483164 /NCGR_PEP_ID=MMETSP1361-20130828/2455_1 /ASSEMBLY_ACC=CAM_ASM_000849 /TAXON_ID=210615 /ORGANISM="Staurosira complex sp., Strain CCMP2646" /LENGTH=186 /DNA_ID=CAMNT_0049111311 /DNA_START=88 /DNA_END=648 /DNA_ORIENTATION=+
MSGGNQMGESLVSSSNICLYDPICMLEISRDVASGYLVLLMGGQDKITSSPEKKRRGKRDRRPSTTTPESEIDDDTLNLSFAAITDGNVVNACFGAPSQPSSSPSYQMARNAKAALAHASDSSDSLKVLAVQSYAAGFRVVMDYNDQMAKLSPCSRCLKEAAIHKAAELDLEASFRTLSEAVAAST